MKRDMEEKANSELSRGTKDRSPPVPRWRWPNGGKTGKSRGYAFVEFRYHEVAKTVAETMNNYLFFDKLLKCELVPQEKIRPSIFRNKINPKKIPLKKSRALAKREVNKTRDELQEQKRRRKQLQGLKKKAATLKSLGIECTLDFPTIEKEISDRKTRIKGEMNKHLEV